jgi:hypothetical protein
MGRTTRVPGVEAGCRGCSPQDAHKANELEKAFVPCANRSLDAAPQRKFCGRARERVAIQGPQINRIAGVAVGALDIEPRGVACPTGSSCGPCPHPA